MVNLKKQLRAYTARQIAEGLGVSERTARRYRAKGKLPQDKVGAFSIWRAEHRAPSRAQEKRVLKMPAPELAAYAGVTPATARKWKKAGEMPEQRRAQLLTVISPAPEPRSIRKKKPKRFKGRITKGQFFEADVKAEVNASVIAKVARWGASLPVSTKRGSNVQFVAAIKSDLALDDVLPGKNYPVVKDGKAALKIEGDRQKGSHIVTGRAYHSRAKALGDFIEELRDMLGYDIEIESVTAIERESWK